MGLREELLNVDLAKVADTFDQLFLSVPGDEDAAQAFVEGEQAFAYGQYPVFETIRTRFEEAMPAMEEAGVSHERVAAILTGMDFVATVLATYASAEFEELP